MHSTSSGRLLDVEVDLKDVDAVAPVASTQPCSSTPSTVPTAG
jgi:hypothetical protein